MATLRFEKALELAQRQLRETDNETINTTKEDQTLSLICQPTSSSLTTEEIGAKDSRCNPSGSPAHLTHLSSSCTEFRDLEGLPNHLTEQSEAVVVEEAKNTVLKSSDNAEEAKIIGLRVDSAELVATESEYTVAELSDTCDIVTNIPDASGTEVMVDSNDSAINPSSGLCAKSARDDDDDDHCVIATGGSPKDFEAEMSSEVVDERMENSPSLKSPEISSVLSSPLNPDSTAFENSSTHERNSVVRNRKVAPPPPPRKTVGPQGSVVGPAVRLVASKMTRPQSMFGGLLSPNSESLFPLSSTKLRLTSCSGRTNHAHTNGLNESPNSVYKTAGDDDDDTEQGSCVDRNSQKDSDSEDSSVSSESQTGTIKRAPLAKEDPLLCDDKSQNKATGGSNGNAASRVPPPVPLRKTSILSTQGRTESPAAAQHQYSNIQELRRELANGNIASSPSVPLKPNQLNAGQNSKTDRRECEETEIY